MLTTNNQNKTINAYKKLNDTNKEYPVNQNINQLFQDIVSKYPHKIAMKSLDNQLTYQELDNYSTIIGNLLLSNGIKQSDYVVVYMERGFEAIVSMLAILKIGAVYIPIDPENPKERNQFIIQDVNPKVVISNTINSNDEILNSYDILNIDHEFKQNNEYIESTFSSDNIAYIIYTSGSTGRPKGALLKHKGLINIVYASKDAFHITSDDVLTQYATLSFDASIFEIFNALLNGATLYLLSKEERLSIDKMLEAIYNNKITIIPGLPSSFFNEMTKHLNESNLQYLKSLKNILVVGEKLLVEKTKEFYIKTKNEINIINGYGPTETTVGATYFIIDSPHKYDVSIPIGRPFNNYKIFILNEDLNLCAVNEPGEIYIESIGLAVGYLNQTEKTKTSFIKHPFKADSFLYKTGDIGVLLENGIIDYIGRNDDQIKIRGNRVELGEIENNISKLNIIKNNAVIAKKDKDSNTFLIGFYSTIDNVELDSQVIKTQLTTNLPSYMIPSKFVFLNEIPIAPTGKIDRKRLENVEIDLSKDRTVVKPQNEIQSMIYDSWVKTLETSDISIYDDFFEVGGHSLKVINTLVQLKPHFPNLKINDVFQYKTIFDLAQYIETTPSTLKENTDNKLKQIIELSEFPTKEFKRTYKKLTYQNILLTGATGYLGSHILFELLEKTNSDIYCLVRGDSYHESYEKLLKVMNNYFGIEINNYIDKIHIIQGDLEKDNLGLNQLTEQFILNDVDAIIHSAADVRHFGNAETFEKTNINGTKILLNFARKNHNIKFHYISTMSIPEDLAHEGKLEHAMENGFSDITVDNLYTNSKLQTEKLLINAQSEGCSVTIYRPGNLTSRSYDGKFQTNINSNAFYRMIKAMLLLKKAPDVYWQIDFTPIDYAAEAIVYLAHEQDAENQVFHICNQEQILYSDFLSLINQLGYEIELLNESEYSGWLLDKSSEKNAEGLELAITQLDGDGAKTSYFKSSSPLTNQFLKNTNITSPKIDYEFIQKMFDYAIEVGYFPR